jgi:VanZ family protein
MRYLPHVLTLCIALGIAWGTLTPMPPPTAPPDGTDKIQHFAAFALLVLPLGWVDIRNALWLAPLALLYGGAIEIIQPLVGRGAEWGDLLADALGIAAGLLPGCLRARSNA